MISIAKSKLIRSLDRKKSRDQHKLFVVEGEKMVRELLAAMIQEKPLRCRRFLPPGIGLSTTEKQLHERNQAE